MTGGKCRKPSPGTFKQVWRVWCLPTCVDLNTTPSRIRIMGCGNVNCQKPHLGPTSSNSWLETRWVNSEDTFQSSTLPPTSSTKGNNPLPLDRCHSSIIFGSHSALPVEGRPLKTCFLTPRCLGRARSGLLRTLRKWTFPPTGWVDHSISWK